MDNEKITLELDLIKAELLHSALLHCIYSSKDKESRNGCGFGFSPDEIEEAQTISTELEKWLIKIGFYR